MDYLTRNLAGLLRIAIATTAREYDLPPDRSPSATVTIATWIPFD